MDTPYWLTEDEWAWVRAELDRTLPFDEVDRLYVEHETCGGE